MEERRNSIFKFQVQPMGAMFREEEEKEEPIEVEDAEKEEVGEDEDEVEGEDGEKEKVEE